MLDRDCGCICQCHDCADPTFEPSCCHYQENGLVPIVEPEVTLGPGDYDIETTAFWSERVYSHVFRCPCNTECAQLD
jgi:Fructose-bisphosphate aldolase class-I